MPPRWNRRQDLAQPLVWGPAPWACCTGPSSQPGPRAGPHRSGCFQSIRAQPQTSVPAVPRFSFPAFAVASSVQPGHPHPDGEKTKRRLFLHGPHLWALRNRCDIGGKTLLLDFHSPTATTSQARAPGISSLRLRVLSCNIVARTVPSGRDVARLFPRHLLCDLGQVT